MKKIYVIHRDAEFTKNCRTVLETAGFAVEVFRSTGPALNALNWSAPSAILLNMSDESLDGLQLMQRIRNKSTAPVILLTESSEEIDEIMGLRLGADAVLRQPISQHLLCEWVKSLLKRHQALTDLAQPGNQMQRQIQAGDLVMEPDRFVAMWRGQALPLTISEFRLLSSLASRPGIVRQRDSLIDVIHDDEGYVDDRSIDSHIKRIRSKIREIDPSFNCIQAVYSLGYRYNVPEEKQRLKVAATRDSVTMQEASFHA
ncbi:response regulator transcription factor [Szabonella alba]|uniref:Response regulator transcription factor n=1 Tax=Szabonella alba TaxID=2804194 RepID=A0A8K0V873_9RHOB|nr:response regulator transcription factor [Szabonella alba]MBL4916931.1 response regulator transcription factor [Szabonella alba]